MENIIKIKKLILMLILCGFMIILAMGSFSAANITVANTTNVDEIQNVISGTNGTSLNPGDTITFKEGVYNLSKGFVINQSINIVGENGNVTFIGNGIDLTTSLANFPGTDRFGVHITANSVNLTGITFIGFFYGISVDSASNTLIDNCIAINNRRGIELTNVNGVTINNTKMNNNQREGINFGGNNIHIVDSEMNNNRFEGVHGHASNSGIYNSTINGNGFGAAGTSTMPGIDLHGHGEGVANFTLEGNAVKYNAGAGLDLNIQKATVINNIFSNNNGNGISIKSSNYDATENLIDSNIIFNNKRNGIEINSGGSSQNEEYSASNNIISNNLIFNNKDYAITINKISPNRQGLEGFIGSIVEDNILENNTIYTYSGLEIIDTGFGTIDTNNDIITPTFRDVEVDNTWTWDQIQDIIDGIPILDVGTIIGFSTEIGFSGGTYYALGIGNTLTFLPGVYEYTNGFLISRSINIIATGAEFVGQLAINISQSLNLSAQIGGHGFLHGLHIVADNVNLTGGSFSGFFYGISVNASSNIKIIDVVANNNRRGIELTNVNGVFIDNTKMNNNLREGTNFGGNNIHIIASEMNNNLFEGVHGHASNSGIYNSTINGNGFGAAGTSRMPGLDLHGHGEGVANFTLEGNAVKYNAGAGLDLNIQKATVINNIFSNNNGNGISIKSSNYNATENLIDNNIISNNKGNGIEFNSGGNSQNEEYSASNNIISNNLIFNNKNGIVINKVSPNRQGLEGFTGSIVENNIMTGNRIFDNIENGIIIDANKNTADDNIIFANGQSGIVNSGSNNIVTGGNILFKNSDSVTPPVTPVRQSTTVTMGNFKGVYNKIVTLSATLRSGNTPISGKLVYFYVNDKLVGEGRTNANGIATYRYRVASTGTLKVNAFFHGDSQYLGSSKLNSNLVVPKMSELHIKNTASVKSRNIKVKNTIANLGHNRGTFKLTFKLHKNLKYAKPLVSTGKVSFNSKTRVLTWTVNNLRLHNTKAATITWNLRANKKGTYNMAPTFVKNNSIKLLSNNSLSVRVLS